MKKHLLMLLILCFALSTNAQVRRIASSKEAIAQQIPGFSDVKNVNQKLINYSRIAERKNEKTNTTKERENVRPAKYGDRIAVDISNKDGNVTRTSAGMVWTLELSIPEALSIGFSFDKFDLSENAELYIYNGERTSLDTAIKKEHFSRPQNIGITPFAGSKVTIYLLERGNGAKLNSLIQVKEVVAGFNPLFSAGMEAPANTVLKTASINCIPLVMCDNSKLASARSVARITVGGFTGTGTMINNESKDGRPYFLTAFHVIDLNDNGVLDQSEIVALGNANFLFQNWYTNCASFIMNSGISFSGASLKAISISNDVVLLELLNPPGIGDMVNYSGWNRTTSSADDNLSYILHHPNGQDMRATKTNNVVTWLLNNDSWDVHYSDGVVAPGSSGAALFNQNGQVVGQLKSGLSSCNFTDFGDQYPKFDRSWTLASLGTHLSPNNNLQSTDLLNLTEIPLYGPEMISCNTPTQFSTLTPVLSGVTYEWIVSAGMQITSGQGTPVATITALPGNLYGAGTVKLILRSPNKGLIRVKEMTKNIKIYTGYFNGTYHSPTEQKMPLVPSGKGNIVYNPACMSVYTNIEVPAGATVVWSGGTTGSGGVTWAQYGKDAALYFTALNQIGYLTVTVYTDCGASSSATYNFKCLSTNSCGVIPMRAAVDAGSELTVYPNPVHQELRIGYKKDLKGTFSEIPKQVNFSYKLFNERGVLVRSGESVNQNGGDATIDTRDIDNGKYFIHITQGGKTIKKQIIVSH